MTDEKIEWPADDHNWRLTVVSNRHAHRERVATDTDLTAALLANPELRLRVLPKMPEWGADQQHALLFFHMQARAEAAESEVAKMREALRSAVQEAADPCPEDMPVDFDGMLKMLMLEITCEYDRAQQAEDRLAESAKVAESEDTIEKWRSRCLDALHDKAKADAQLRDLTAERDELRRWQDEVRISLEIGATSLAAALAIADAGLRSQPSPTREAKDSEPASPNQAKDALDALDEADDRAYAKQRLALNATDDDGATSATGEAKPAEHTCINTTTTLGYVGMLPCLACLADPKKFTPQSVLDAHNAAPQPAQKAAFVVGQESIRCSFCSGSWPVVDKGPIALIRGLDGVCICQSCAWRAGEIADEHAASLEPADPAPASPLPVTRDLREDLIAALLVAHQWSNTHGFKRVADELAKQGKP